MTLQKFITIAALAATPLLAACGASNTDKDFLCPVQTNGSPCATIGEADGRRQGAATTPVAERRGDTLGKEMSGTPLGIGSGKAVAAGAPLTGMKDGGIAYSALQYRTPEEVGTLWVAPHLDSDGLLHEATYVHFVVREAQWNAGQP